MHRFHQILLIATFLPLCWLGFQAVHELGHVLGAAATGGKVAKVVLHPLTISRTDMAANPKPALVVWAGPTVGSLVPLALLAVFKVARWPGVWMVQFFAGACLVANGGYLGSGSLGRVGDAGDLSRLGCPMWQLWLFAAITSPSAWRSGTAWDRTSGSARPAARSNPRRPTCRVSCWCWWWCLKWC